MVLYIKLLAHQKLCPGTGQDILNVKALAQKIAHRTTPFSKVLRRRTAGLRNALDPLSSPTASTSYITALLTNNYPTVQTLPTAPLALDLAPFVRSIASSDLRLEAERLRLSQLLSEGGNGGTRSSSKKMRTTRASRAALEGGFRKSTRRERWWKSAVGYLALLGTGGTEWAEIAAQAMEGERSFLDASEGTDSSSSELERAI